MISWQAYNHALIPLIQRFGAIHYPKDVIQKGFFYWKTKDEALLLDEINRAIAFNQPLELVPASIPRPERSSYQPETYHQTDGFLDAMLEANGVTSVIELLEKQREKVRQSKTGSCKP